MAKNSIRDYSATNSANTDIQSIDISEGCSPAGINNAIREVMADLKDVSTGAVALESPAADSLSVTGDLTVDTNTLYVDSTNNRVGIGTSTPNASSKLHVVGGRSYFASDSNAFATYLRYNDSTAGVFVGSPAANEFQVSASSGAALLKIDSSGSVGIGTASPVVPLHLKSSSPAVSLQASASKTSGNRADFNAYNSDVSSVGYIRFGAVTDNVGTDMQFAVRPAAGSLTEAMRLTSAGDFLVGATSFNYAAIGVGLRSSNYSYFTTSNAYPILVNRKSSVGILINFAYEDSSIGTISTNGVSTAYNTTSDYRLKTAVEYDWDATSRLKQLKPVRFNFIADADTTVDGFLAHEVQDVVPEAIVGEKDGMRDEEYQVSAATGDIYTPAVEATYDEDGAELTAAVNEVIHSADVERPDELEEGQQWRETTAAVMGTRSVPDYQGIDQSKLVPLLVKTIQELEARITALEAN